MGDIGPTRQHYDVLPVASFGFEDSAAWPVPGRMTVPNPAPPPRPEPGPDPVPSPEPRPDPGPFRPSMRRD